MSLKAYPPEAAKAHPTGRAVAHALLDRGALAVLALGLAGFWAPAVCWVWFGPELAPAPLGIELVSLVGSALLALMLPLLQIALFARQFGGPALRSNREGLPALQGLLARVERAHANLVASLLPFAAVVLTARAVGVSNRITAAAATVYLAARLVHASSLIAGIVVLRSAAYYAGLVATVTLAAQLPLFG